MIFELFGGGYGVGYFRVHVKYHPGMGALVGDFSLMSDLLGFDGQSRAIPPAIFQLLKMIFKNTAIRYHLTHSLSEFPTSSCHFSNIWSIKAGLSLSVRLVRAADALVPCRRAA